MLGMGKIRVDETALNDVFRAIAAQGEQLDQVISVLYAACNQLLGEEFTLGTYSETVRQQLLTYRANLIRLRIRMDDSVLAGRRAAEALENIDLEQRLPKITPQDKAAAVCRSSAGLTLYQSGYRLVEYSALRFVAQPAESAQRIKKTHP